MVSAEREAGIAALDEVVAALLAEQPRADVSRGRMFGGPGWRLGARFFAFSGMGSDLIVKLPEEEVSALVASGAAEPLVMRGRPMREWARLPLPADGDLAPWREAVSAALAFAAG